MASLKRYIFNQQYFPGFWGHWLNPFYHARFGLRKVIGEFAPQMSGRLLDVGCGQKPYKSLFVANEYIGLEIDTPENRKIKPADLFYDGKIIPFQDSKFDGVICNQVLEHIFEPDQFLKEVHRVIKPDGMLLLTVPFIWDEHEQPWDYARYSSFGLTSLLKKNGFDVLVLNKVNDDVRALFQLINSYIFKVFWPKSSIMKMCVLVFIMGPVNILGTLLYKFFPKNKDFYLDLAVLAKKS